MSEAEQEMWDAVAGVTVSDTRKRLFVQAYEVNGHSVKVSRINGTRSYVVAVDDVELSGYHGWTVDALNAGRMGVSENDVSSHV